MNIPQITFSRFVAAIAVVVYHYGLFYAPLDDGALHALFDEMYLAVSYFFLLSGFIMAVVYWDGADKPRIDKRRYWMARVSRIYPLYLFALFLSVVVVVFLAHSRPDPVGLALSVPGLQAWIPRYALVLNFPGWSLCVELFFYAVFPLLLPLLVRLRDRPLALLSLAAWALSGLAFYVLSNAIGGDHQGERLVRYWPPLHFATFLFGAAFGVIYRRTLHQRVVPAAAPPLVFVASMLLFAAFLLVEDNPVTRYTHNGLLSPLFMVAILAMCMDKTWVARLLAWRPLEFLGEISYGIYILQFPIYEMYSAAIGVEIGHHGAHYYIYERGLHFAGYVVVLVAASAASFLWVEKPLKALLRRGMSGRRRLRPAV